MKMDRNIPGNRGLGKYALVKLRNMPKEGDANEPEVRAAISTLIKHDLWDWGIVGTPAEFMVMRLKDKYAYRGLMGYYKAIILEDDVDDEYAQEILDMAKRAGPNSQWCKKPD